MLWYLRFQTIHPCPTTRWPLGIFRAANYLRASAEDQVVYGDWVEEIYEWFNSNLAVPPECELDRRAVFWFLPDARKFVSAAWSLAAAYREAGIGVTIRRTDCPGRVVYRDKHQIAAIPYWPFGRGPPVRGDKQLVLGVWWICTRPCEGRRPGSTPGKDTGSN
jgi:hypothetical protein